MRIRYFLLCLALVLGAHLCPGQTRYTDFEGVEWFSHLWGGSTQRPEFVEVDDSGNVYVAGTFQWVLAIGSPLSNPDTVYFSKNYVPFGNPQIFFIKYNPDGELLWFNTIERVDESFLRFWDFSKGPDGTFLMMGSFADTVVTARGDDLKLQRPGIDNGSKAWGVKLFPDGRLETFMQAWRPGGGLAGFSANSQNNGNLVCTFRSIRFPVMLGNDTIFLDSIYVRNGNYHTVMATLDKDGELVSYNILTALNKGTTIHDTDLNPWTGDLYAMIDLSVGPIIYKRDTIFGDGYHIFKFNPELEIEWQKGPISLVQFSYGMTSDSSGNLYLANARYGGDSSYSRFNAYITKYHRNGNVIWQVHTDGKEVRPQNLQLVNGLLYCTGDYVSRFDFGNVHYSISSPVSWAVPRSGFLARLDAKNGELDWVMSDPVIKESKGFIQMHVADDYTVTIVGLFDVLTFTLNGEVLANNFSGGDDTDGVVFRLKGIPPPLSPPAAIFKPWLEVWPNPSAGTFSIGLHEKIKDGSEISLWDLRGRKVLDIPVPEFERPFLVNALGLPEGIYWLRVNNSVANVEAVKRLVIVRPE